MAKKKEFGIRAKLNADAEGQTTTTPVKVDGRKKENKLLVKTYNYKPETLEKVLDIAYWDRENIWQVIDNAIIDYAKNYEKKNGPIKPRKK